MKALIAMSAALVCAASVAVAAPVKMTDSELDSIVAGGSEYCPPDAKGNNGWGNGADGTNNGSFSGGTSPSKSTNASAPGAGKININPTTSDGR